MVAIDHSLKGLFDRWDLSIGKRLHCAEFNIPGDGNEERDGVDIHNINGQGDVPVCGHDGWRNSVDASLHMFVGAPDGFSFERSEVRAVDVLGDSDVPGGDGQARKQIFVRNSGELLHPGTSNNVLDLSGNVGTLVLPPGVSISLVLHRGDKGMFAWRDDAVV